MTRSSNSDAPKTGDDTSKSNGEANRRVTDRLPLVLNAQCLVGYDQASAVWLIDISQQGCQLFTSAGTLEDGQDIVILRNGGGRHQGRVVWVSGMKAGVRFRDAISTERLEHLLNLPPDQSREVSSDSDRILDRFGRELAPLPIRATRPRP